MPTDNIIEVTEMNFQDEVLVYSQNTPVVVDFWADWCGPCRMLTPLLEQLTKEASGSFRLAKLDVDVNPNLASRFNIHSVPAVKAFRNGQIVAEFTGAQPESYLRNFLRQLPGASGNLALDKAHSLFQSGEWETAVESYRLILDNNPAEAAALFGLAKGLLVRGDPEEALEVLRAFPASREYNRAQNLLPLAQELAHPRSEDVAGDHISQLCRHALHLVSLGNLPAAVDGLLEVLRQDKSYRGGLPRQLIIAILEIMGKDDPLTGRYRDELAATLF